MGRLMNSFIEGAFSPPAVGAERPPAPIAGPGRIELTPHAMVVTGFKPRSPAPRVLLFFIVIALGVAVFKQLEGTLQWTLAGAVLGPLALAILQRGGGHDVTAPLRVEIPWSQVEEVKLLDPSVLIGLRGFASAAPLSVKIPGNAIVHFVPTTDRAGAVARLNASLYASRAPSQMASRGPAAE